MINSLHTTICLIIGEVLEQCGIISLFEKPETQPSDIKDQIKAAIREALDEIIIGEDKMIHLVM